MTRKNLIWTKKPITTWKVSHVQLSTRMKRVTTTINICFKTIYKISLISKTQGTRQYIYFNSWCNACCKNDFCHWIKPHMFKSWAGEIMNCLSLMPGNNVCYFWQLQLWAQCSIRDREMPVRWSKSLAGWFKIFLPQKNRMNFWWIIKTSYKLSTYW